MKREPIKRLEEKRWIIAYYFTRNRFNKNLMFKIWTQLWPEDFTKNGELLTPYKYQVVYPYIKSSESKEIYIAEPYNSIFQESVTFIKGIIVQYSKKEIRDKRLSFRCREFLTLEMERRAETVGLKIHKSDIEHYPARMDSFRVTKLRTSQVIAGYGYDLSLKEVEQIVKDYEKETEGVSNER